METSRIAITRIVLIVFSPNILNIYIKLIK